MTTLHRLAIRLGLPLDLVRETWSERAAIREFLVSARIFSGGVDESMAR
jgi:hypothetical protein